MLLDLKTDLKKLEKILLTNISKVDSEYRSEEYINMLVLWEGVTVTPEMQKMLEKASKKKTPKSVKNFLKLIHVHYLDINMDHILKEIETPFIDCLDKTVSLLGDSLEKLSRLEFVHFDNLYNFNVTGYDIRGNQLVFHSCELSFHKLWKILDTSKWRINSEKLEYIELEGVEFITGFEDMLILKGYSLIQKLTSSRNFLKHISNNTYPVNSAISIGKHDSIGPYLIYNF